MERGMSVMFWWGHRFFSFSSFTPSAFFSSNYFLFPSCIHIASLSCLWFLLLCVHSCYGEKHLCAFGNPSAFHPCEPCLCLSCFRRPFATCWESALATCWESGEVFSYVLISIWQKRKLWEFPQHLQTKLLSFTSRITQILNAGSKKI